MGVLRKSVFLLFAFVCVHFILLLQLQFQLSTVTAKYVKFFSLGMNFTQDYTSLVDSSMNQSYANVSSSVSNDSLIQPSGLPVLVFCVLSAARPGDSYLETTLESLKREHQTPLLPMKLEVVVIDVSSGTHREDMRAAQQRFSDFAFEPLLNRTLEICSELEMRSDSIIPGRPPCSVMQQTRDVLAALEQCSSKAPGPADWVSLIEDDTEICPGAAVTIASVLPALSARPGAWRYAGFSTYFSGASFPAAAIPAFLAHAAAGRAATPIDHLVWQPWAPGQHYAYAGNLLAHRGRVSVFAYRNTPEFRGQYDEMRFSPRQSHCAQQPLDVVLRDAAAAAR
jgi:hypothetical protein